jgi:hypothetical protein
VTHCLCRIADERDVGGSQAVTGGVVCDRASGEG